MRGFLEQHFLFARNNFVNYKNKNIFIYMSSICKYLNYLTKCDFTKRYGIGVQHHGGDNNSELGVQLRNNNKLKQLITQN